MLEPKTDSDELSPLSGFAPKLASMFVSMTGGIALVIDKDGVIGNVAVADGASGPLASGWVGRHWAETVTGSTRNKIMSLLQEVGATGVARRREVNHPSHGSADIPISYSALRLGTHGPVLAVGRDLRAVTAIQQHIVSVQRDMERDHWNSRRDQDKLRLLSQVVTDAVMVVDARTSAVLIANEAAQATLNAHDQKLPQEVLSLLAQVQQTEQASEVRTRLKSMEPAAPLVDVHVIALRDHARPEERQRLMVRIRHVGSSEPLAPDTGTAILDTHGRIIMLNDALLAKCRDSGRNDLFGQSLCDLLDGPDTPMAALIEKVLRDGIAQDNAALLGGRGAALCEATMHASLMMDGNQSRIGISVQVAEPGTADAWILNLQTCLAHTNGKSLDAVLREVARLTERHLLEDALRRSTGNLDTAGARLGVEVVDLEQRLKRLGIDSVRYIVH